MKLVKTKNIGIDDIFSDLTVNNDNITDAIVITEPEHIKDMVIEKVEIEAPNDNEVQIEVYSASINFGDYLSVKGMYPTMPEYPFCPGFEVSGVVRKVGSKVTEFKIGDEVIGLMNMKMGGHSRIVNTEEELVIKKPANISFEEGCAFPVVFLTIYHAFKKLNIKKNEKILIQTAAGGTGLIAVQMALNCGAEIYATVGSQEKIDFLNKMGLRHIINYQEKDFEDEIRKMTDGYGVDAVINTLSGDAIQKGIDLLAPNGRYIEIAMVGLKNKHDISLANLTNNQSIYSVDLRKLLNEQPDLIQEYMKSMFDVLSSGAVKPTVGKIFAFEDAVLAYENLEHRENIGKIVLQMKKETKDASDRNKYAEKNIASEKTKHDSIDIAIIGVSCRFPEASNKEEFWENIKNGRNCITEVPKDRWNIDDYYNEDYRVPNTTYCRYGGFIRDIDKFDPVFFRMSGKEAELTDPQQRIFLEECYNALDDAGYANLCIDGSDCSVYVGAGSSDYLNSIGEYGIPREAQSFWGNANSVLASRISYYLNLHGESVAIDTACSSSLVAIYLACNSILNGKSSIAIAGGVFVSVSPDFYLASSNAKMLSSDGICKAFDDDADGFVPGEGAGAIILKELSQAKADHDHIYGVIKGISVNQDGRSNGITAPSSLAQTAVELDVYERYHIPPQSISYIETHGTGTKLGDPIEIEALTEAFRKYTDKVQFCPIGSVKTNIGHAATAAGMASVIKVVMALKDKTIPPSLNYRKKNRHIDFDASPFYVNTECKSWNADKEYPRRAAVSGFGFSGTNCHIVIEEYCK